MKKYDVVIVNYNGEKIISDCLNSLYKSTHKPESVIIYDNASADNSVEIIKNKYPRVNLISGKKNLGFGRGNNEAMKHSESEFILFMNNDVLLDQKCAENLLRGLTDPDLAISNPLIIKGWDKKRASEIYSFGAEMNKSGFGYGLYDTGKDRNDLNCFSGACFMARANVIKKLQFEKSFFLYYEEPDLSTKILRRGYKIGRHKDAVCYHLESYSSPKKKADGICFRQFYAIQNRFYMLGKYWPTLLLINAMPLNIIHLIYNIFFFIANGKWQEISIIYLSFAALRRGRKEFKKDQNYAWTKKLAKSKISTIFSLQKKVYR